MNLINMAYERALECSDDLSAVNANHASPIRDAVIDALVEQTEQIADSGFFTNDADDFSPEEVDAIVDIANTVNEILNDLRDTHELTLMALQCDVAEAVQKVATQPFRGILLAVWARARQNARGLPAAVPEEVYDDFNVGVLMLIQGRLNQLARNAKQAAELQCLNADDYNDYDLTTAKANALVPSAQSAVNNYVKNERLKAADEAARAANDLSIFGEIWSVIGWDSPTDFLWDVGLTLLTGGASKVFKWGRKLVKMKKRAGRAAHALEDVLKIEKRVARIEHRAEEIRATADKIKKAKRLVDLPGKIAVLLKELNNARGKARMLEDIGKQVTSSYIRSVVSSLSARGVTGRDAQVGNVLTKEAAITSALAYLDGTSLGKEIKSLRSKVSFALLITKPENSTNSDRYLAYLALLTARQFIARLAVAIARRQTLSVEIAVNEFIDSAASAIETVMLDLPFLTEAQLKSIAKTVVSTIRKVLAQIARELAGKIIDAI